MLRLAVLVSGSGTNLQAIIDGIESGKVKNTEITLVISNREKAYALERAKAKGIKTAVIKRSAFASQESWEEVMITAIERENVGLIVLAGFMAILSDRFVKHFKDRIINIHPSLIPSFCGKGFYGLKVHEAALKAGVLVSGATVHYVNEIVDGGKIIAQKAVDVLPDDTPESLGKRILTEEEWEILPAAINKIANDKSNKEGG